MVDVAKLVEKAETIIGNFTDIFFDPCMPTAELWVELGLAAAFDVIAAYGTPDPRDIYHRVMGESELCSLKKYVQEAGVMEKAANSQSTRFLFTTAELGDLATWYGFLAAIAATGLVHFTSNILYFSCDPNKRNDPNRGQGAAFFGGLDKSGRWQTADFTYYAPSQYAPASPSSIKIKAGHSGFIAAHAVWHKAHVDTEGYVEHRIINTTENIVYKYDHTNMAGETEHRTLSWVHLNNGREIDINVEAQWRFVGDQPQAGTAMILAAGRCSKYGQL